MLIRKLATFMALLLVATTAMAWGSRTQTTIVTNAAHLITREGAAPLANLERDIRGGAAVPAEVLQELAPQAGVDAIAGIESQMTLLQAVRGPRIDPYYAFRLGVLGRLVAEATAPLQNASPDIRSRYYEDVDGRIDGVSIRPRPRREVDPGSYFASTARDLSGRDGLLEQEYRAGLGFQGVAQSALPEDASRSINAVADVWYTVLNNRTSPASVSNRELREYQLGAMEFYILRGSTSEINRAYERIEELGLKTPEIQERIADKFFEAGLEDRAIEEYRAVLEQDPERRHIAQRIAEHFIEVGEAELEQENLEAAREAFSNAADADKLNETAQTRLVEAERAIDSRTQRRDAAVAALDRGESHKEEADRLAERGDYAQAIDEYRQARSELEGVSDEFVDVVREARLNMNTIEARLRQLQDEVVASAGRLSGAGSGIDPGRLARADVAETDEEALKRLVTREYEQAVDRLRQRMESELGAGGQ